MATKVYVTGGSGAAATLSRQVAAIKRRTFAGMWEAVLIVVRRSKELTPVDTGNLINSAYVNVTQDAGGQAVGEIGYTAAYAPFVHEVEREYKKPGSQWKFLETALKEKAPDVLEALRREAEIK